MKLAVPAQPPTKIAAADLEAPRILVVKDLLAQAPDFLYAQSQFLP